LWISRVKRGASRRERTKPPPSSPPPRRARGQALTPRRRREGIRQLAEQLLNRPQLGRDVFQRGQPEPIAEIKQYEWSATLYQLLSDYAAQTPSCAKKPRD
jgi:segregation and condensation protein A